MSQEVMVCRCEDITREEILQYIEMGFTSLEEIKRVSRAGMGNCQGRTCMQLISQILSEVEGLDPDALNVPTKRPPVTPISIKALEDCYTE